MSAALISAFYDVGEIIHQQRKAAQVAQLQAHKQYLLNQHAQAQVQAALRASVTAEQPSITGERRILGAQAGLRVASSSDSGHSSPILGAPRDVAYRKLDRSQSEPAPITVPKTALPTCIQQQLPPQNVNSSRYKTEMCRPFEENGHCKYGDKCQFAHGVHELRSLSRHPKYKTELCRTFHTIGFCPYGPRCHFIHNEDLRRLSQISQQKAQMQAREAAQVQSASAPLYGASQPTAIQRPKALSFNMHLMHRESLGSTAEDMSPPPSFTDSPTASLCDELDFCCLSKVPCQHPITPQSAPATRSPPRSHHSSGGSGQQHFIFPGDEAVLASLMRPLNVQINEINVQTNTVAPQQPTQLVQQEPSSEDILSAALQALQLQRAGRREMMVAPSSPPDSDSGDSGISSVNSTCGSPLEVSRGLRLPIFSQLSCSDHE